MYTFRVECISSYLLVEFFNTFLLQSIGRTYVRRQLWLHNRPHIRGPQFIIISTSERICQFLQICKPPQQMSINITTLVTLKKFRLSTPPTSTGQITPCVN